MIWPRPVPIIGDITTAVERDASPGGWAFAADQREAFYDIVRSRRDIRRFRPDEVPEETVRRVLTAAHSAPSVGHSQPWRFVTVRHRATRERAAWLADRERLAQAARLDPESGRHLLDLQLEGIREAPLGIVVCCDRRTPGAGVLGRATFDDADMWSCACAIQNLWLAARAEGLGVGWVTLFEPNDLAELVGLPDGVCSLGWLCVGWPDERPPGPGLERFGWSERQPLDDVVLSERWDTAAPDAPPSRLRAPDPAKVVNTRDDADGLLTPPGSLGVLDRAVDRVVALGHGDLTGGTLVLVAGDHPVADLGVSAFRRQVTADVVAAAYAGEAVGVVAARAAGLAAIIVDAGSSTGDLLHADALSLADVDRLVEQGIFTGERAARSGLVVLGEVGIGNTTVASALCAALLGLSAEQVVGLGSSASSSMLTRKREVIQGVLDRVARARMIPISVPVGLPSKLASSVSTEVSESSRRLLASLGGPEFAYLTGVVLGAVHVDQVVVLDGFATSVAALCAAMSQPAVVSHLIAGQRSREKAHALVLAQLGLEPLLDLRLRAGEGVGGCLAAQMLLAGLTIRRESARTAEIRR